MPSHPNLFDIEGVTRQRELQCAKCPDTRLEDYTAEDLATLRSCTPPRAHRCHSALDQLCAGPLRPRILK